MINAFMIHRPHVKFCTGDVLLEFCEKVSSTKNLLAVCDFSLKKTSQEFRRMSQKVREFLRHSKNFEETKRNLPC